MSQNLLRCPNTMSTLPLVSVGKEQGYVFHAQFPGAFCFVPASSVTVKDVDAIQIHQGLYVVSDWSRRNLFLQPTCGAGAQLFPDEAAPVMDLSEPGVSEFIQKAGRLSIQRD